MQALIKIIDGLTETMGNIQEVANQVASGSYNMSVSAEALSKGATEQASAAERSIHSHGANGS